jgi:hypothetical protein
MQSDILKRLEELRTLIAELDQKKAQACQEIEELEAQLEAEKLKESLEIIGIKPTKGDCYVQKLIQCGKPTCQCAKGGKLHGPYWYLSKKKQGKTTWKYIGKDLPVEAL